MWAALKKAVTGVTESLGIEIPGLPADLGALGETVASVGQGVADTAAGSVDGLAAVGEQVTGAAAGSVDPLAAVGEQVTGAAAGAAEMVPDVPAK